MFDNEIDRSAPYAPVNSVLAVVRRFRDRGLPIPLTAQELTRVGVSEGNASRTLQALKFLDLIDAEGAPTATFERLRRASSEEYPELLADILRHAYREVFQIVDPASATDIQINDAFRNYRPQAQRPRMVVLFTGLCKEAGLIQGDVPEARTSARKPRTATEKPAKTVQRGRRLREGRAEGILGMQQQPLPELQLMPGIINTTGPVPASNGRFALLQGLLQQLPSDGQWTAKRRGRWLQAFTANLDLLIEVTEESDRQPERQLSSYVRGHDAEGGE